MIIEFQLTYEQFSHAWRVGMGTQNMQKGAGELQCGKLGRLQETFQKSKQELSLNLAFV